MSLRSYAGPRRDSGERRTGWFWLVPFVLTGLGVAVQISWVLVRGETRALLTIASVLLFFAATITHAWSARGAAWAGTYAGITLAFGFGVEVLGTATRFPFGDYAYGGTLGPSILSVPLLIPFAWAMMAYPCLLVARRLAVHRISVALIGGFLLASWDLFLDPQMVSESYWTWRDTTWTLPGIDGIPLQNFLGWLLSAFLLMLVLAGLPERIARDGAPTFMITWIYASSVLANVAFFGRGWVALWGGVCMGAVLVPFWYRLWSRPQW